MAIQVWISPRDVCALLATRKAIRQVQKLVAEQMGLSVDAAEVAIVAAALQKFYSKFYARCVASRDPDEIDVHVLVRVPRLVYTVLRTLGFCLFSTTHGAAPLLGPGGHPVCASSTTITGLHVRDTLKTKAANLKLGAQGAYQGVQAMLSARRERTAQSDLAKAQAREAEAAGRASRVAEERANVPQAHQSHEGSYLRGRLGKGYETAESDLQRRQQKSSSLQSRLAEHQQLTTQYTEGQAALKARQEASNKELQCRKYAYADDNLTKTLENGMAELQNKYELQKKELAIASSKVERDYKKTGAALRSTYDINKNRLDETYKQMCGSRPRVVPSEAVAEKKKA